MHKGEGHIPPKKILPSHTSFFLCVKSQIPLHNYIHDPPQPPPPPPPPPLFLFRLMYFAAESIPSHNHYYSSHPHQAPNDERYNMND